MEISPVLASIHAYLCADGYVTKNLPSQKHKYYVIALRNTNDILLKDFQEKFERVFKIKPRLIEGQRSIINSKLIYLKITKEFGSFYSWKWRMPKMKEKPLRAWLRSYFDCEGWVTCKSHQNRMIGADCVNEKGIKQIKIALKKLGIKAKVKKRNTRNIFSLFIFGKENLKRFNKKIGFLHPLKKERLEKVMNDYVNYKWDFKKIEEIIKAKAKVKKPEGSIRVVSNLKSNLLTLKKEFLKRHRIKSKLNQRTNGLGTKYYELSINKKEEVKYIINKDIIAEKQKQKWLMLQK